MFGGAPFTANHGVGGRPPSQGWNEHASPYRCGHSCIIEEDTTPSPGVCDSYESLTRLAIQGVGHCGRMNDTRLYMGGGTD